jgi:hypothetical protein
MIPKKIKENVILLTSLDWDRRLFDSLIPLPDGTRLQFLSHCRLGKDGPHRHHRPEIFCGADKKPGKHS